MRYAVRTFVRSPVFAAGVVLTLALGIGGATAMFSIVHSVLLRPLPFREGEQLVRVQQTIARPDGGAQRVGMSQANVVGMRERSRLLESAVAHRYRALALAHDDGAQRLVGIQVSDGWLRTVGVQPLLGRGFSADEEAAGEGARVVVIGHALWQTRFGGDPAALGGTVTLNGAPHTIVGVMPPGYAYPYEAELWVPMRLDPAREAPRDLNVTARLRPGASPERLQAELDLLAAELRRASAGNAQMTGLVARPMRVELVGDSTRLIVVLFGAVGFVLLIACANVASLLLARAASRRREFGIRTALGASRARQVRQLLTESVLLAMAGGALGVAAAVAAVGALGGLVPETMREVSPTVGVDLQVLAFSLALSLGCGIAFGLAPALRASSLRPWEVLRSSGRMAGGEGSRVLHAIVVAETAISVVLLAGGGLLVRDLVSRLRADTGVVAEGAVSAQISLPEATYGDAAHRSRFVQALAERVAAAPGVAAAGVTSLAPFSTSGTLVSVVFDGRPEATDPSAAPPSVQQRVVTPGFFPALGVRLLRGRLLTDADAAGAEPVVVVNATLAARFWPGENPVGRRVREAGEGERPWRTVVGVVADVAEPTDSRELWYAPYAQVGPTLPTSFSTLGFALVVRAERDPSTLAAAVRGAVRELDVTVPVFDVRSVAELERAVLAESRMGAFVTSGFGLVGLALAALGLYGVLAYVTGQRRREIAIRMALGAEPGRVLRSVIGRSARIVGLGLAIGLAASAVAVRALGDLVGGTPALDPVTLLGVGALLSVIGVAASLVPARRAARVDAAELLRGEG